MPRQVRIALAAIACLVLAAVFFMTYFTVDQNEMTVVTRFGHLEYVADPGLHFKVPFVNATTPYRTDIQDLRPDKGVNTYTVDNQEVDVVFTVFFRIPPDKVAYIYTNNRDYRQRLFSLTIDRLKAAMGQVNVQSVAEKRGELRDAIKATLVHDASALGVEITDFQLTDMQYTDAFRQAVNNAAVQKANIEAVEYQRQQAEKQAATAKIAAEGQANAVRAKAAGDADARLLQAAAEAKAIELQGAANAKAIQLQAEALKANPDLVELRRAERWNGVLPAAVYGSAPIPFLNVQNPHPQ
ncbi:MAG TPA: SPFH domain-containing protein [Stellaceae bacterium]|nr:SPFH domain-containing protein [Stellaceae bacterium]